MKHSSENDLNGLASWMLGITGTSLLLIPFHFNMTGLGILWMDIPEGQGHKSIANPNDLQALVNQTAIALERSVLLVASRRQANEIKAA